MDRNLALEFVRVTEAAAIAAAKWVGRGDRHAADGAAVEEMRARFNQIDFRGTVVIGEGEKDQAPMLFTGEVVGQSELPEMDLAVDPLEATDSVAHGRYDALSVIATGPKGALFSAPDTYMEKIAAGSQAARDIDLDAPVDFNIKKVAQALGKDVAEVTVVVLDRPRHEELIAKIRESGARVRLITDGDVASAIAACLPGSGVDLLMGIGGSTEAVLAAVPIKILGGEILCRFAPQKERDREVLEKAKLLHNAKKIYRAADLARGGQMTFTATGIIDGPLLPGVRFEKHRIITHSVVMRASSGTIRYITTHHHARPQSLGK